MSAKENADTRTITDTSQSLEVRIESARYAIKHLKVDHCLVAYMMRNWSDELQSIDRDIDTLVWQLGAPNSDAHVNDVLGVLETIEQRTKARCNRFDSIELEHNTDLRTCHACKARFARTFDMVIGAPFAHTSSLTLCGHCLLALAAKIASEVPE